MTPETPRVVLYSVQYCKSDSLPVSLNNGGCSPVGICQHLANLCVDNILRSGAGLLVLNISQAKCK